MILGRFSRTSRRARARAIGTHSTALSGKKTGSSQAVAAFSRDRNERRVACLPIFALCSILAPQILRLLYGAGFTDAAAVFRIYLLLLPLRPTAYGTVLQALGDTHTVLKGGLMAVALNATLGASAGCSHARSQGSGPGAGTYRPGV
jgi:hypothetical protein